MCTFMKLGASPSLDFSEVKGSKSLFRWVDLLRSIMLLHCDRLEAERQSGQNKDEEELKKKTELNLSICITYPILHLSIRTIQFVFLPLMPGFPPPFRLLHQSPWMEMSANDFRSTSKSAVKLLTDLGF